MTALFLNVQAAGRDRPGQHPGRQRLLQAASAQPQVTGPHTVVVEVASAQGFYYLTGGQPPAHAESALQHNSAVHALFMRHP